MASIFIFQLHSGEIRILQHELHLVKILRRRQKQQPMLLLGGTVMKQHPCCFDCWKEVP